MAPRGAVNKLRDALRLLLMSAAERRYARLLRDSPEFDRAWYLASNPRLHPLFRRFPERHYVREGEAMGLCPNPGFSPYAYLAFNPDLAGRGVRPLEHFILTGRAEGRSGFEAADPDIGLAAPAIGPGDRPDPCAPVAVALHLYYPELWAEFAARLAAQGFDFDLYVTLTGPAAEDAALGGAIAADFPRARIWRFGNRGRDVLPFLTLVNAGLLAPYRAVCKLHGKVSPHRRDGAEWRQDLVGAVMGAAGPTRARLDRFLADPAAGLWVADGHVLSDPRDWGINRPRTAEILARGGLEVAGDAFPAGSIWWVKPQVLDRLAALGLTAADFEPERGLVDGTTAHAVERAMATLVLASGLAFVEASALD